MENRILKNAREDGTGMSEGKVKCLMKPEEALLVAPQSTEFPSNP
jgi:hypothetical protein